MRRRHLAFTHLKLVQAVAVFFKFIGYPGVIDILFFLRNHLQEATGRHALEPPIRRLFPLLLNFTLHFIIGHLKLVFQPRGDGAAAAKAVVTAQEDAEVLLA